MSARRGDASGSRDRRLEATDRETRLQEIAFLELEQFRLLLERSQSAARATLAVTVVLLGGVVATVLSIGRVGSTADVIAALATMGGSLVSGVLSGVYRASVRGQRFLAARDSLRRYGQQALESTLPNYASPGTS